MFDVAFVIVLGALFLPVTRADEVKFSTHGEASLGAVGYAHEVSPANSVLAVGRMSFDSTLILTPQSRIRLAPVFRLNPFDFSPSERFWADLPAGYAQYDGAQAQFRLGFDTRNWGVTDIFNPLDITHSRNNQDPLNAEKLGAFLASIRWDLGPVNLEAIYIPLQRTSRLPGTRSRWLPRELFTTTSIGSGSQTATLLLPSDLNYAYTPDQERDHALSRNFGLRARMNGIAPGLDLSFSGFEGSAPSPTIDVTARGTFTEVYPSIIIQAEPDLRLTPVYYRQDVYSASLVYANFGMILRSEVAVTRLIAKGDDLPGDTEEYVVELERGFEIGEKTITLIVEGAITDRNRPVSDSMISISRLYDRAGIVGLRFPFSEILTLNAGSIFDLKHQGSILRLEANHSLSDDWKINLAGDFFQGGLMTPIGTYRKNNRLTVTMKVLF